MWSFHLRAVLTLTPKSWKEKTCSVTPLYSSGRHDSLNLAGAKTISLVFFQLIFIKLDSDHLLTELRWFCTLDCSLLRNISERVVSSTNLCVRQVGWSFIRDTKQSGPSQEPWGNAPLRVRHSINNVEIVGSLATVAKEQSHRIRIGSTLKDLNLSITKLWETRLNAFSKSIKKFVRVVCCPWLGTNGAPCALKLVW